MPDADPRAGVLSKRALVTASHAVERAALADGTGADTVVFALFQRLPYFEREREVYARIARKAAVTVVGMVDSGRPDLPHGVTPVLLRPDEPMAREWSVAVLSPTFGASVVAQDLDEVDPRASSVERARLFRGRWGLRRDEAYAEVVRLRDAMGDRLPPAVRRKVGEVLASVETPAAVDVESRAEAALRHVASRLDEARASAPVVAGPAVDPDTGLETLAGLTRWLGDATDTVPLGLVLVVVDDLGAVERRHGTRVRMHTEQNIADLLRGGLRPLDRAVRLGPGEFLVIQPAVPAAELASRSAHLERRLAALHATYPFVDLHPRTTTLLTRRRPLPLPLPLLRAQLREVPAVALWPPSQGSLPIPPASQGSAMRSGAGVWFR